MGTLHQTIYRSLFLRLQFSFHRSVYINTVNLGDESMDPIWKVAVKATGAVGVVGLLFSLLLKAVFQQQIIDLFGSDKMFYIVILIICVFGLALLLAIAIGKHRATKGPSVVYRDNSKHQGDNRF